MLSALVDGTNRIIRLSAVTFLSWPSDYVSMLTVEVKK